MRTQILSLVLTALVMLQAPAAFAEKKVVVSEAALLKEMLDRDALAKLPSPAYSTVQFSSYDRKSVSPDQAGWYANSDHSYFLRTEEVGGRIENVMLETEGPGAIVRFWMTLAGGENGTVRIYIDGNSEPVLEGAVLDLLSGDLICGEPLATSVSKLTVKEHRGHDLYYPIPYSRSCKVTYQRSTTGKGSVYYNIECRQYADDVVVVPFTGRADSKTAALAEEVNRCLSSDLAEPVKGEKHALAAELAPGEEMTLELKGSKAIEYMRLRLEAGDYPQALRSTVLSMEFDSEATVWVPVGDFFGTGYSPMHQRTFFNSAEETGELQCAWVMPFASSCRMTIHNYGDQPVKLDGSVSCKKWKWDERSLHFGASWWQLMDTKTGTNGVTMPKDANYVTLTGQGKYVGDVLTLFNTTRAWWGEGDEKVYVDGESFPSHFGTGTEDYYGYAWCEPRVFTDHPFIGLPIGSGNLGIGRTVNCRFRSLDAITFDESLRFDMEIYEWDNTRLIYAPTCFWYLRPGGSCNIIPDVDEVSRKVVMKREDFIAPTLSSYIEGEDMTVESYEGKVALQRMGNRAWSYCTILFLTQAPEGSRLMASFNSPYEAVVRADAIFAIAKDYGTVNLYFNGEKVVENENLWNFEISSRTVPMGEVKLRQGRNTVELEIVKIGDSDIKGVAGLDRLAFYSLP